METILVNGLIGLFLLLFGAMAVFPFLIDGKAARRTPLAVEDDVVISIQPVATAADWPHPLGPLPVASPTPDRREAA